MAKQPAAVRAEAEFKRVTKNLNAELGKVKISGVAGLLEFGLIVQADAQKRTPREYSNLVSSAYTQKAPGDPNVVEVGYASEVAVYVHENLEQKLKGKARPSGKGTYWGPSGEPRFLSKSIEENTGKAAAIVQKHAKVKAKS